MIYRYEHQWTFPRAFHVSPFNDRSGFYRVSLADPLRTDTTSLHLPANPELALKIVTLTSEGEKKLFASLSGPSSPLQSSSLLRALLRWPFSLLLTTPRILYQAMLLHYGHRLDVFPRPDPFVETGEAPELSNPVEKGGKDGSVQWQEEGPFETLARERTVEFLHQRVYQLTAPGTGKRLAVVLQPADRTRKPIIIGSPPGVGEGKLQALHIYYLTPLFFSDLLASPSMLLALNLGSKTERRWWTNDDKLFLHVFTALKTPSLPNPSIPPMQQLRLMMMRRALLLAVVPSLHLVPTAADVPPHPLDDHTTSLSTVWAFVKHYFWWTFGAWIFGVTRARFVKGSEPWGEWARWAARERKEEAGIDQQEVRFGSVLRASRDS